MIRPATRLAHCATLACCVVVIASAFPDMAISQTNESGGAAAENAELQEVIVTAEKRATNLQSTPIAVTAFNGAQLASEQVQDMRDLSAIVPSLKAGENGGFAQITIRGIGILNFTPLAESAVAVNENEVYISRQSGILGSMFDVSGLEVLRGPQGTLFGRNATAGAVNMTTARPTDELSGYVRLTAGNYNEIKGETAVAGPIVPGLLTARIAAFSESREGYGKNLVTGNDVDDKRAQGVRGTVVLTPATGLKITVIEEYYHEADHGGTYHYFGDAGLIPVGGALGIPSYAIGAGGVAAVNSYNVNNDQDSFLRLQTTTSTGIIEYSADAFSVKSISGYRNQQYNSLSDIDGTNLQYGSYLAGEPAHQFSEELQFHYDTQKAHLTSGLYYFSEDDSASPALVGFASAMIDPQIGFPPRPNVFLNFANIGGTIFTKSRAAFAQGSYEIADGLSLTAGIRFSRDTKHLISNYGVDVFTPYDPALPQPAGQERGSKSWSSTTPKFGIEYQVTPITLVYATYAKGFKAGGFDYSTNPAVGLPSFNPEKVTSYEGGLKTTFLDGKARTNLAGFYYDYSDLQVSQAENLGIFTTNAGKARIYGLEGEVTVRPAPRFEMSLNGSYLHARYTSYFGIDNARPLLGSVNFDGKALNNAPDWSGAFAAQYTAPLGQNELVLRGECEFSSRFFFSPGNYDLAGQSGYAKLNAVVTYRKQNGFSIMAFGRNLADKMTRTSAQIESINLGNPVQGSLAPPRTFGVEAAYDF